MANLVATGEAATRECRAALALAGVVPATIRDISVPYRICPLGAHSDHQGGVVLGQAINVGTHLAFVPTRSGTAACRLESLNYPGVAVFDAASPVPPRAPAWARYAWAASCVVGKRAGGPMRGVEAVVQGDLPGGGLSSSASVLVGWLLAFAAVNDVDFTAAQLVHAGLRAEVEGVGVKVGLLDPASIVAARRGHLLAIDCADESWQAVPPGPGASEARFLVCFSGVTRALAGSEFNQRVTEAHAAAARLAAAGGLVATRLGELPDELWRAHGEDLPEPLRRRARHFFAERARVLAGLEAWRCGDLIGFGAAMSASCRSSLVNWEVGSRELVALQGLLVEIPGVLGARFSGAGFAGCVVALVEAGRAEACRDQIESLYCAAVPEFAMAARFFVAESVDGVQPQ